MPTDLSRTVKMQASADVNPTRILEKGPSYLRKQMELEGDAKGRQSAVERLAASKAKYVKSQQVVGSKQEPVITLSSASESSNGSSIRSSNRSTGNRDVKGKPDDDPQARNAKQAESRAPADGSSIVRRSSSKRQRPDSLVMYRQNLVRGPASENSKGGLMRRLFLSTLRDKSVALPEAQGKECAPGAHLDPLASEATPPGCPSKPRSATSGGPPAVVRTCVPDTDAESERAPRKGVFRSHSDISSRYSKNFSEFETFFKYCGLDGDVIESLGKQNFTARSDEVSVRVRSVSVATSDDGFTRTSGDSDGLLEVEVKEKNQSGTSVIERNARIIKWLYSCKNANESGKVLRDLH
ncbi:protein FAM110C [Lepisosteus oculatus]|uniref:protein FAM110C n=1 Tax=Lepisosteus oculatus TaxID=7918 RepID=UPI0035F516EC